MDLNAPFAKTTRKTSLLVALSLFMAGIALELTSNGKGIPPFSERFSLVAGITLMVVLLIARIWLYRLCPVRWLSTMPAAYSAIGGLLLPVLIMGLTPQTNAAPVWQQLTGFSHIIQSWPFLIMILYLLVVLGLTTLGRGWPREGKQWTFVLNHLGLWIIIFGATFGAPAVQRLKVELTMGVPVNEAVDRENHIRYQLPVGLVLDDFVLEQWPPQLAIVDHRNAELLQGDLYTPISADSGAIARLGTYTIHILEYYDKAGRSGNRWYFNHEPGAAPAVLTRLISDQGDSLSGWISCGSISRPYESLKVNDSLSLVMLFPEARNYRSDITLLPQHGAPVHIRLEVNKPVKLGPYLVYQTDYDSTMGEWSQSSVIELVKDPWLPVVYTGIFLLLAGTLLGLIRSQKITSTP